MSVNFSIFQDLKKVNSRAFEGCPSLEGELNLGNVPYLGTLCFGFTSFSSVVSHKLEEAEDGYWNDVWSVWGKAHNKPNFGWKVNDGPWGGCYNTLKAIDISNSPIRTLSKCFAATLDNLERFDITGCSSLEKLDESCLQENPALTTVVGWDTEKAHIKYLGASCFRKVPLLNIDISNMPELREIGTGNDEYGAFLDCTSLTTTLENCPKLELIGRHAFRGCTALGDVDCSNDVSLREISEGAFYAAKAEHVDFSNCTSLTSVKKSAFRSANTVTAKFDNCTALEVMGGGDDAWEGIFLQCSELQSFSAKNCTAITSFGGGAWGRCPKLESVDISSCPSLRAISKEAMVGCGALTSVNLTGDTAITKIWSNAFENCVNLPTIIGWDEAKTLVETIGYQSFMNDNCLNINLSNMPKLKRIEDREAFINCYALSCDLKNWPSIEYIGEGAFQNCSALGDLDVSGTGLTEIGPKAFQDAKVSHVDCSGCVSLSKIGSYAFCGAKTVTADFSGCSYFKTIEGAAFKNCENLTTFTLGDGVPMQKIGDFAFTEDAKLKAIYLPDSALESIGERAFEYNVSLETFKVKLSESVPCTFAVAALAGWRNEASGKAVSTSPLVISIIGSVPPTIPAYRSQLINGVNNANTPGLVTIHFSASAESAYKAAAQALEDAGLTDGELWYWCCPDGSMSDGVGSTGAFYATAAIGTPTIVFDL